MEKFNVFGVLGSFLDSDGQDQVFFKPYKSSVSFLNEAASVVTAPVIFTGLSAYFALNTLFELTKSVGNLLRCHPSDAKGNLQEAAKSFFNLLTALILVVVSPVVNLVNTVGRGISTVTQSNREEDIDVESEYVSSSMESRCFL